jgi:hypothetical protein
MGQEQSSNMNGAQGPHKSCRPCGDWGQKDHGTVKVDAAALHRLGKENATHPNVMNGAGGKANMMSKEGQEVEEKARQRQEWEAKQEELRRQEEERKEMERRVKEEQERQQAELRRREAERRRLQLEQEAREREELERQRRAQEEQRKQEAEARLLEEQRREEERRKKLQEIEDQKKIRAWLQANGFKGINDLVRKRLSKVAPLQFAIQQNDVEMLGLLLQNGADASKVNGKNESALAVAQKVDKKGSHAAVVQALMTYAK